MIALNDLDGVRYELPALTAADLKQIFAGEAEKVFDKPAINGRG